MEAVKKETKLQKEAAAPQKTPTAAKTKASVTPVAENVSTEQAKTAHDSLQAAVTKGDGPAVVAVLKKATPADLISIGSDDNLMTQMMLKLKGPDLATSLDYLHMSVSSVDIMAKAIKVRFGVNLGSVPNDHENITKFKKAVEKSGGKEEQKWTINGARRVYSTYMRLPQAHLDKLRAILTYDTQKGSGGGAIAAYGAYHVGYSDKNLDKKETTEHCEKDAEKKYGVADSRVGLKLTDMTMAHELGHIVDLNEVYSRTSDFRKISGWQEHSANKTEELVEKITDLLDAPLPTGLSNTETRVAKRAAVKIIKNRVTKMAQVRAPILEACADESIKVKAEPEEKRSLWSRLFKKKQNAQKDKLNAEKNLEIERVNAEKDAINADELAEKLEASMLITHAVRGLSDNSPWYRGELFDGMKRQIHEGYTAQNWYSYDNTAWSKGKISMYQFRNPSEEFAELYSSYHVANPKGSKNSDKHTKWFESKGLHKMQQ